MSIKQDIDKSKKLIIEIAKIGKRHPSKPLIQEISTFEHYFDKNGNLIKSALDKNDGPWTRREILTRYLLLSVVLDQGPDIEGVRLLLKDVVNTLYRKEVRIFHRPLDFFRELGISIDAILEKHDGVKKIRADTWAKENNSIPSKYNLFFTQSPRGIISTKQVLDYSIHRWATPLCVPLLLEKDLQKMQKESSEPLVDYIESWDSAEIMSQQVKDNERYGLGSAIGDKAGHLFAKLYIHTFGLVKRKEKSWENLSWELPFDSNAGRVLFRTGFLTHWANLKSYKSWNVIQKEKGKGGLNYIRVTNIRGRESEKFSKSRSLMDAYRFICLEYLKTRKRIPTTKVKIQQIPNVLLLETGYGIGHLDDGLVYIGTNFCFNHDEPKCRECPINNLCEGYNTKQELITKYRT